MACSKGRSGSSTYGGPRLGVIRLGSGGNSGVESHHRAISAASHTCGPELWRQLAPPPAEESSLGMRGSQSTRAARANPASAGARAAGLARGGPERTAPSLLVSKSSREASAQRERRVPARSTAAAQAARGQPRPPPAVQWSWCAHGATSSTPPTGITMEVDVQRG
jgi:hypothetical protein